MAVPRSADFFKVLTLFGIHFLLSDPLTSLVLKNPRAPTTTSITFVFALKSPNISLAKSWHPYCFAFSLLSRLLSPGTAMSRRGLCCYCYHGQLHVCQAQGKISWYFHFFILSYPCRAMLVPLATKFQMNNPGQCVVLWYLWASMLQPHTMCSTLSWHIPHILHDTDKFWCSILP